MNNIPTTLFNYLFALIFFLFAISNATPLKAQCTDFDAVVNYFYSYDAIPGISIDAGAVLCADSCAATGTINPNFQVYTNEAYLFRLFPGASYVFDFCEDYDANFWQAEITATTANLNFNNLLASEVETIIASVQDCQLQFTLPNNPISPFIPVDVLIIVADVTNCGGNSQALENGLVTFACDEAGGQPDCATLQVACDDALLSIGTTNFSDDLLCPEDTLHLQLNNTVWPNVGDYFGSSFLITETDISYTSDLSSLSDFTSFSLVPTFNLSLNVLANEVNTSTTPLTLYYTPIVLGNASLLTSGQPPLVQNLNLEESCTFVGASTPITFLPNNSSSCLPACPVVTPVFNDCLGNQIIVKLKINDLADYPSITLSDSFNTPITLNDTTTISWGLGEAGQNKSIIVQTPDGLCNQLLNFTIPNLCDTACNGLINGGFENTNDQTLPIWTETASSDDVPVICSTVCSGTGINLAYSGTKWAWFGGIQTPLVQQLEQVVSLPETASTALLSFRLKITNPNTSLGDTLRITVDSSLAFTALSSQFNTFEEYTLIKIPIGLQNDSSKHLLRFEAQTDSASSFFIDEVKLSSCEDACLAYAGSLVPPKDNNFEIDDTLFIQATGFNTANDFSLFYLLTENVSPFNIVALNQNGIFPLETLNGNYQVRSISIANEAIDALSVGNSLSGIQFFLNNSGTCSHLSPSSETYSFSVWITHVPPTISPQENLHLRQQGQQLVIDTPQHLERTSNWQLAVYNIQGQLCYQDQWYSLNLDNTSYQISLEHLPSGLYIAQVWNELGQQQCMLYLP